MHTHIQAIRETPRHPKKREVGRYGGAYIAMHAYVHQHPGAGGARGTKQVIMYIGQPKIQAQHKRNTLTNTPRICSKEAGSPSYRQVAMTAGKHTYKRGHAYWQAGGQAKTCSQEGTRKGKHTRNHAESQHE